MLDARRGCRNPICDSRFVCGKSLKGVELVGEEIKKWIAS